MQAFPTVFWGDSQKQTNKQSYQMWQVLFVLNNGKQQLQDIVLF